MTPKTRFQGWENHLMAWKTRNKAFWGTCGFLVVCTIGAWMLLWAQKDVPEYLSQKEWASVQRVFGFTLPADTAFQCYRLSPAGPVCCDGLGDGEFAVLERQLDPFYAWHDFDGKKPSATGLSISEKEYPLDVFFSGGHGRYAVGKPAHGLIHVVIWDEDGKKLYLALADAFGG